MGLFDKFKKPSKPAALSVEAPAGTVLAPVAGNVIALGDVPDPVFSSGVMGKGCGIEPSGEGVARLAAELLLSAEPAMNMAVLRTPPGGAMYLAGSIDRSGADGVLGTVAGDDTVFVVTRTPADAASLCRRLLQLADRTAHVEGTDAETRKTS